MTTVIQNNLEQKYHKGTIRIHWISAFLILVLFGTGIYMEDLPAEEKSGLIKMHAALGLLVLFLTLVRTWLFFKVERPEALKTGSKLNDKLTVWVHNAFYVLLFVIVFSGIAVMLTGGYAEALSKGDLSLILDHEDIPLLKLHGASSMLTMLLFAAHAGGVLKHYIKTKENTLKRMS